MKKILFIAPTFFGYYKEIIKVLEKNYEIDYIEDIPNSSNIYKAVSRVKRNWTKILVKRYFTEKIKPLILEKKYDYVFIIIGMTFSLFPEMIEEMKKIQNEAKFIMYQWDGEKNISFVKDIHKYFDDIYTFDRIDAEENNLYKFLPLFYIDKYEKVGKKQRRSYKYDVSYIGTAHPQKIKLINEIAEKLKKIYPLQYIYHYIPSKIKYYYHKILNEEYKDIKFKDLKTKKVSFDKAIEIFEESKCILDAPQKGQNGLTIRTIECLGAKRKLITTNKDIVNYDFYCPENIYVYDESFDFNSVFFKTNYKEIDVNIYEKYSLHNWINEMIK